ncbi:MAG: 50S ribosomal protein L17 [Verrucomicrobiota bacterium]|nr:50S ribosomal protein L17 [Verrucomicrobiota bacterium]MEE2615179.1 50S ribosomal protein L17 [Verrucomicrobiota bacterium]
MRHRVRTAKLGRTGEHRNAMLANLVCSLIKNDTIKTTLAKAKAARVVAEKMVTLGKKGTLHHRRLAVARLRAPQRKFFPRTKGVPGSELRKNWTDEHDVVRRLFDKIVPRLQNRQGGYTRIVKLAGARKGDAAQLAYLTWVFDDASTLVTEKSEAKTDSNIVESKTEDIDVSQSTEENANADEAVDAKDESEPISEVVKEPEQEK